MQTLEKNEKILGYDALALRDALNKINSYHHLDHKELIKLSITNWKQLDALIKMFISEGYLEEKKDYGRYMVTDKGGDLCRAKCIKRMTRAKANELYLDILDSITTINNDDYYFYKVTKLYLFGSFITDKETLGDIDICVEVKFKDESATSEDENSASLERSSGKALNYLDRLYFCENEVYKRVKNRRSRIHLSPISTIKYLETEFKEIDF